MSFGYVIRLVTVLGGSSNACVVFLLQAKVERGLERVDRFVAMYSKMQAQLAEQVTRSHKLHEQLQKDVQQQSQRRNPLRDSAASSRASESGRSLGGHGGTTRELQPGGDDQCTFRSSVVALFCSSLSMPDRVWWHVARSYPD